MKNTWIASLAAVGALICFVPRAEAQITTLYSTGFNSPTYSNGPLNPGTDVLITPGQDGWLNTSGGGTNNILVSNTATNGFASLVASGQDVQRPFTGGATISSGSLFYDADVTVTTAPATGDYALHFTDNTTSGFFGRAYFRQTGAGFQLGLATSSGTTGLNYGTELNLSQTYRVLVRYDIVAGATNDTGALYINPTTVDGSGDTPYITALTTGADAALVGAIALRQGTNSPALTVDNFRAFTTVIPEPTSMALCGVAVAGLAFRRWRRK